MAPLQRQTYTGTQKVLWSDHWKCRESHLNTTFKKKCTVGVNINKIRIYRSTRMTRLPKRRWQTPQMGIVSCRIVMGAYWRFGPPREDAWVINSPWNSAGKKQFPIAECVRINKREKKETKRRNRWIIWIIVRSIRTAFNDTSLRTTIFNSNCHCQLVRCCQIWMTLIIGSGLI